MLRVSQHSAFWEHITAWVVVKGKSINADECQQLKGMTWHRLIGWQDVYGNTGLFLFFCLAKTITEYLCNCSSETPAIMKTNDYSKCMISACLAVQANKCCWKAASCRSSGGFCVLITMQWCTTVQRYCTHGGVDEEALFVSYHIS